MFVLSLTFSECEEVLRFYQTLSVSCLHFDYNVEVQLNHLFLYFFCFWSLLSHYDEDFRDACCVTVIDTGNRASESGSNSNLGSTPNEKGMNSL